MTELKPEIAVSNTKFEMPHIDENTDPKTLWEPAKEGENLQLGDVWVPNRAERRKMKHAKGKKRGMRALGQMFEEAEKYAKNNPEFKQDIYRALYENLKLKAEEKEKELEKESNENGRIDEGN